VVTSTAAQVTDPAQPIFRSAVDLVSVAATVKDRKGRLVRNLVREDFEVLVSGNTRPILSFEPSTDGPVSLALVVDLSGSMRVSDNLVSARNAADQVLSWFRPTDEGALFLFDRNLYEVQAFTSDVTQLRGALDKLEDPFGATSIFDAVARVATYVGERATKRRAIVVFTDGFDTSSKLTAAQVSSTASRVDMPIYTIVVGSALDHPIASVNDEVVSLGQLTGELCDLAHWTGGECFAVTAPAHASVAARQIVSDLRHQYLLAFESSANPGWHRLDIRMRKPNLTVRTRGGYLRAG
jgi:Ca-activated chloride channel homolog